MNKTLVYSFANEFNSIMLWWEDAHKRFRADTNNQFTSSHGQVDTIFALAILSQGGELGVEEIMDDILEHHADASVYKDDIRSALESISKEELDRYLSEFEEL